MSMWGASEVSSDAAESAGQPNGTSALAAAAAKSPRAHLFAYYPLLLRLAFVPSAPSMWVTPSEYYRLFGKDVEDTGLASADEYVPRQSMDVNGDVGGLREKERGEEDMVEVSARELARRALELVGEELCLGQ